MKFDQNQNSKYYEKSLMIAESDAFIKYEILISLSSGGHV